MHVLALEHRSLFLYFFFGRIDFRLVVGTFYCVPFNPVQLAAASLKDVSNLSTQINPDAQVQVESMVTVSHL